MNTFIPPNKSYYSNHPKGTRWGILCTDPWNGEKTLFEEDHRHFAIFEYKLSAQSYLKNAIDQTSRKNFKMKVVKLIESYTLAK